MTGTPDGPRAIPEINKRGPQNIKKTGKVVPSDTDLELIAKVYAADFERFAYDVDSRGPTEDAPSLSPTFIKERDQELKRLTSLNSSLKGYVDMIRQSLFHRR